MTNVLEFNSINELVMDHKQIYDQLPLIYEKSKQKLLETRQFILQKVLKDIPCSTKEAKESTVELTRQITTILDVGCGIGANMEIMQSMGYNNLHGIDISYEMIKRAKENLKLQDDNNYLSSSFSSSSSSSSSIIVECKSIYEFPSDSHRFLFDIVFAQAFIHLLSYKRGERLFITFITFSC